MVVIRVLLTVKQEHASAFFEYMQRESTEVRKIEGCNRYQVYGVPHTGDFLLYEEWASKEAFDAYRALPIIQKTREVIGPMLAAPPESAYYETRVFK